METILISAICILLVISGCMSLKAGIKKERKDFWRFTGSMKPFSKAIPVRNIIGGCMALAAGGGGLMLLFL